MTSPAEPAPGPLLWAAPLATRPVGATISLPGSKSMTNRALVLAALADEPTLVRRPLRARDTELMARALRVLGAEVLDDPDGDWQVIPGPLRGPAAVDCGLAGTVMRFVPPVAGLAEGTVRFDGDPRARQRPMRPLLRALRAIGVDLDVRKHYGLPFSVYGSGRVRGGEVTLDASASSQFLSGLLLAAPRYEHGILVRHTGRRVPSLPHIEMTMQMLARAGADPECPERGVWRVLPRPLHGGFSLVEPDLSSAAPFLAAAVVTGGEVWVPDWPRRSPQPGMELPALLRAMGAKGQVEDDGLVLRGTGRISGIDADLADLTELVPVLTALAALADSPSSLHGIGHMRGHETDRLAALAKEINGLGGDVVETADGLEVHPRPLHGGTFATYHDHRLAMAGAVLGLAVPGIQVENVATTAKTLPAFPAMWSQMVGTAP